MSGFLLNILSDLFGSSRDLPQDGIDAAAAEHYQGHRVDTGRFGDIVNPTQHWVKKEQPTPGAMQYAYESLGLPEFGMVNAGIISSRSMCPVSKPSYQSNKSVPITGFGGVVGTIVSQPLYDPASNTFGGAALDD
jgi:hypothetical protein